MLDLLETPITVIHVFVCLLLMLVVLIQPGKSGGLGAALGGAGAQQLFGGRGAGNFLSRATWISAVVFFLTSITLAYLATSTGDSLQDAVAAEPPTAPEVVPAKSTTNSVSNDSEAESSDGASNSAPGSADEARGTETEDSQVADTPQADDSEPAASKSGSQP